MQQNEALCTLANAMSKLHLAAEGGGAVDASFAGLNPLLCLRVWAWHLDQDLISWGVSVCCCLVRRACLRQRDGSDFCEKTPPPNQMIRLRFSRSPLGSSVIWRA